MKDEISILDYGQNGTKILSFKLDGFDEENEKQ